MCSIFSVCSRRFSVSITSMTSCNLLSASFGASSSSVRFHFFGRAFTKGVTLPVFILLASAQSGPKADPLSLSCHGFNGHQRSLAPLPVEVQWSSACPLHPWLQADVGLQLPRPSELCIPRVAGCRAGTTVLHRCHVHSRRDLSVLHVESDSNSLPNCSNAVASQFFAQPIVSPIRVSMFVPIVVPTLMVIHQLSCVIIRHLVLVPSRPSLTFMLLSIIKNWQLTH